MQPPRRETFATAQSALPVSHGEKVVGFFCCAILLGGTFSYFTVFQYKLYFVSLILITLIIIFSRIQKFSGVGQLTSLLAFAIYQAASSFWSPNYLDGLGQAALDLAFMSFAVVPFMYSNTQRKWLSLSLIKWYGVSMLCCIGWNFITVGELVDAEKGAFRSAFGVALLVALPVLTGEAILNRSITSAATLLLSVLIGVQLESRLFTLFFVPFILASILICYIREGKRVRLVYPVLAISSLLVFLAAYQVTAFSGFIERSRLGSQDTSLTFGDTVFAEANAPNADSVDIERRLATQVAIDSFRMSPIFGTGYMSTSYYVGRLTNYETAAHGLPAGLLAETGSIGTLLFVFVCALTIRGYMRRSRACPSEEKRWIYIELLTFIAALVAGLFHQVNHDFYLYLLIGGGLAASKMSVIAVGSPRDN